MPTIKIIPKVHLSRGNRIVHRLGTDKVIKWGCPKNGRSGSQNRMEGRTWNEVKWHPLAQKHLAKVHSFAPDGSWLIQDFVEGDEPDDYKDKVAQKAKTQLRQALFVLGMSVRDMHSGNWRVNPEGEGVMIDYGYKYSMFTRNENRQCGECMHCNILAAEKAAKKR